MIANPRLKIGIFLSCLFLFASVLPAGTVDPWNLVNVKKIAFMIFALVFVQALGVWLNRSLGARLGSILSGFLGGLISSTATVASIARASKNILKNHTEADILTYLSATLAMLLEGVAILYFGSTEIHPKPFLVFLGPVFITIGMILFISRRQDEPTKKFPDPGIDLLSIAKLSTFVIGLLILSKILQRLVGPGALLALTFLVSFFEIHGSIVANVQLFDDGVIREHWLGALLGVSVAASYLSKLFIIITLGNSTFKKRAGQFTLVLLLSLVLSWLCFFLFT